MIPKQRATLPRSGTLRRLSIIDNYIYTLTDQGMTGEIRKFSRDLTPILGKTTPYAVNDMVVSEEGIVITGHHFATGLDGLSISSPMIAKIDLNGSIAWQRDQGPHMKSHKVA